MLRALMRRAVERQISADVGIDLRREIDATNRFQARLLACPDRDCIEASLRRRLAELEQAPKGIPTRGLHRMRLKRAPVGEKLRARLLSAAGDSVDLGERADWSRVDLRGSGRHQVVAWGRDSMHNNPVALWAEAGGRWRLSLSTEADGVQVAGPATAGRWPGLVVTRHAGAGESGATVYGHRRFRYEPLASCALAWTQASNGLYRRCEGETPWPRRGPPAQR